MKYSHILGLVNIERYDTVDVLALGCAAYTLLISRFPSYKTSFVTTQGSFLFSW